MWTLSPEWFILLLHSEERKKTFCKCYLLNFLNCWLLPKLWKLFFFLIKGIQKQKFFVCPCSMKILVCCTFLEVFRSIYFWRRRRRLALISPSLSTPTSTKLTRFFQSFTHNFCHWILFRFSPYVQNLLKLMKGQVISAYHCSREQQSAIPIEVGKNQKPLYSSSPDIFLLFVKDVARINDKKFVLP